MSENIPYDVNFPTEGRKNIILSYINNFADLLSVNKHNRYI